MLTSTHCNLARYAYDTGCTQAILPLIEKTIVYYPGMTASSTFDQRLPCDMDAPPPSYITKAFTLGLKATNILEYDLVCGMTWLQHRNWAEAFAAFERVVTYPTRDQGVSKIMVAGYKRWVLVGLLLNGHMPTEPAYASGAAKKAYSTLGKPYQALCSLFGLPNGAELRAAVEKFAEAWDEDNNVGLVREVLAAYQKWQIINLQDVYSKISIPEIRAETNSAETGNPLDTDQEVEDLLAGMIETGMLKGVIERPTQDKETPRPPYLVFHNPQAEELDEAAFKRELAVSVHRIKALGALFRATNERLTTSKDYVKFLVKEQKHLEKDGGERGDPLLGGFDSQIEDEDLMTGVVHNA
jgi:COP9 signalosome complex subunit 3